MTDKINIKELEVMVANLIKEMGLNEMFTEEMNNNLKEKIKNKINSKKEKVMQEEEGTDEPGSPLTNPITVPMQATTVPAAELPSQNQTPITTAVGNSDTDENNYKPQLPSSIEKVEPEKVFIFDYNELSLGGENLSHKTFRLLDDPDKRKTMQEIWMEDAKIRAEVYVAKFEKIGDIIFDPFNGTSKLEEKRFDPDLNNIAQPFNENPNMPGQTEKSVQLEPLEKNIDQPKEEQNAPVIPVSELETKIYDILSRFVKGMANGAGPVGLNIPAISAGQIKEPKSAPSDTLSAILSDEKPIFEGELKMLDLIKDEGNFIKIETPDQLKESIKGKNNLGILLNKNDQVQSWKFEGKIYHLPAKIISLNKCYVSKETL